jgi:hypothetical protein
VRCVKGIINLSKFEPKVAPNDAERMSEEAIRQSVQIDASRVPIEASLEGTARAWAQQYEAGRVVWAPPGITKVDNQLIAGSSSGRSRIVVAPTGTGDLFPDLRLYRNCHRGEEEQICTRLRTTFQTTPATRRLHC